MAKSQEQRRVHREDEAADREARGLALLFSGRDVVGAVQADGANKAVMDGDWVCARFGAPDFLVNLIIKVGKGEIARAGRPS